MTRTGPSLDADAIHELFEDLSHRLATTGAHAQLFVVGGAAMALAYDRQRATQDVDAAFEPSDVVRDLTALIAQERGLEDDWLNDAAKGFLPGNDDDPVTVFESDNLLVQVPSAEYLLAMKIHASRSDADLDDAARLYQVTGYTSADQVIDLLERLYPPHLLLPRHRYVIPEVIQRARPQRPAPPPAHDPGHGHTL